jgi:4-alpha-glucanotransferase
MCDYLRIDHFRGLESYWSVPAGETTAINGKWVPGPREDLFRAIAQELGENLPIIAEDLGLITPQVHALRETLGFPGMKILQFAFEGEEESSYLPHRFTDVNCVCYTGTHDNNTTAGWYANAPAASVNKVHNYMNTDGNRIHIDFVRTCLSTIAKYAIFPLQDLLGIGSEGRMNTPGLSGEDVHNWAWRYKKDALCDDLAIELAQMTRLYGRDTKGV